jgi:hypothetical protein
MTMMLGLVEVTHAGDDSPGSTLYEVTGLPEGHQVFIRRTDGQWKVLRVKNGVRQSWNEGFDTVEDAFDTIRAEHTKSNT